MGGEAALTRSDAPDPEPPIKSGGGGAATTTTCCPAILAVAWALKEAFLKARGDGVGGFLAGGARGLAEIDFGGALSSLSEARCSGIVDEDIEICTLGLRGNDLELTASVGRGVHRVPTPARDAALPGTDTGWRFWVGRWVGQCPISMTPSSLSGGVACDGPSHAGEDLPATPSATGGGETDFANRAATVLSPGVMGSACPSFAIVALAACRRHDAPPHIN